eukprot:1586954-Prymnesium_polylepis.2
MGHAAPPGGVEQRRATRAPHMQHAQHTTSLSLSLLLLCMLSRGRALPTACCAPGEGRWLARGASMHMCVCARVCDGVQQVWRGKMCERRMPRAHSCVGGAHVSGNGGGRGVGAVESAAPSIHDRSYRTHVRDLACLHASLYPFSSRPPPPSKLLQCARNCRFLLVVRWLCL